MHISCPVSGSVGVKGDGGQNIMLYTPKRLSSRVQWNTVNRIRRMVMLYIKKQPKKLKNEKNDSDGQISLFQVLLSNITYNIFVEVIYLIVLIILVIVQIAISPDIIPYIISIWIFLIIHR